ITTPQAIGELLTYDYAISADTLMNRVVKEFDKHPELPGVLIIQHGKYVGALSRRKVLEELSLPYGVELFYKRPVSSLCQEINISFSPLPARMRVEDAVRYALDRSADAQYEPLVVSFDDGRLRLLDMHILLMAQSQLLVNANQVVNQLFNVSRTLASSLDVNVILDSILIYMKSIVPYKCASVVFFRDEKMDFMALRGFPAELDIRTLDSVVAANGLFEIVRRAKKPLYISDVAKRPDWVDLPDQPVMRTWLSIPLLHWDEVLGMLLIMRAEPDAYIDDQIVLAQTFAEQAALALKNALLFKEVNAFTQQLEMTIDERTRNLQAAYQKLENMDRTKNEFIQTIISELDQPIKQISGYGKQLLTQSAEENQGAALALVNIGEGVKRLRGVLERLQEVALIDSTDFKLQYAPVELAGIMRQLADTFGPLMRERRITCHFVHIDKLPAVYGDERQLYKVFYHLIENAIRYTPNKGRITVKGAHNIIVENGVRRGELQVSVRDTGVGIPRAVQGQIFDKFYKNRPSIVAGRQDTGGAAGLGLAIARKVVEAHNGRIWVESSGRDEIKLPGSTFYVVLPTMQNSESPSTTPTGVTL
ncbi:MAG: ATP-binding protein, partial [Anaerolineales bacterium]